MFMTEYTDKRDELYSAIERNRKKLFLCRHNKTSPEYHKLRKEQKTLKKTLETLENQYWG